MLSCKGWNVTKLFILARQAAIRNETCVANRLPFLPRAVEVGEGETGMASCIIYIFRPIYFGLLTVWLPVGSVRRGESALPREW